MLSENGKLKIFRQLSSFSFTEQQQKKKKKEDNPKIMASAIARTTFSFHYHTSQTQSPPTKPRPHHLSISPKSSLISSQRLQLSAKSIDVSSEDKPISEDNPIAEELDSTLPTMESLEEKIDKRRMEEKFAVLNTGVRECRSCGYLYNQATGDPSYPIPPGLPFDKLPEDWRCATCGAAKSFFESKSVEIAGFAQNQQFGLGGNTLTSSQKLILIYGALLFFFVVFLSGYFLQ